jgi:plastocyanin
VVAAPLVEGEGEGEVQTVTLAAPEGAAVDGFSTDALAVSADVPIELEFDNADPGVQHNVVIADGPDAQAPPLFEGKLLTGPDAFTYVVNALGEGEYAFFCEVHPTTMVGTLTASPGGGGGGESGGVTVVASGLAFDTSELALSAGTESTVTFDNEDAGTPHNIAIYTDDSATEALFTGDLVTGVASIDYAVPALEEGDYYFRCDVHPDMNGAVVVGPGAAAGGAAGPEGGGSGSGEGSGGSGGGGGSGTAAIVAQGTAFDTSTLQFPADTEVTLTFDNQDDAAVTGPHNLAIFEGETALFEGELVDGPATVDYAIPGLPAGTYEFRCEIHPQMAGSVDVS